MKFYTRELWRLAQDGERAKEHHERWRRAHEEYILQLATLRSRISADAYAFFSEADVHDGELLKFSVVDGSRPAPLAEPPRRWRHSTNYPVKVELVVLDARDTFVWHLRYSSVRRVTLDYPTAEPLFYRPGEGFGDLGFHELTDAGDDFLRHEVLFSTGSELTFEFRDVAVNRLERNEASSHFKD